MRLALLSAFAAILIPAAELKIDHVTIAGSDLKKMQAGLAAAGIQTIYGGPHSNHATEMALVSFPDGSYLELIALQPNADQHAVALHPWAKFLTGNAGPCAWAVREKDLATETKRLRAAGIRVPARERSGRQRPDGVRLEWETAQVGDEPRGTFFPFPIQDLTPRKQRAYPEGNASNKDFSGVSRVVILVKNLDDAVKRYREAYGLPRPIKQVDRDFHARLALIGGTPVVLAQPLSLNSWLGERLERFGEGPVAFVLAARKPGRYHAASQTRWFGVEISWFDPEQVGWHLGFEGTQR